MKTVMRISVDGKIFVCFYCEKDKWNPYHLVEKWCIQGSWCQKLVFKYENFQSVLHALERISHDTGWGE